MMKKYEALVYSAVGLAALFLLLVACGVRGFALDPLGPVRRIVVGLGGLLLIGPGVYPPMVGIVLAAAAISRFKSRAIP